MWQGEGEEEREGIVGRWQDERLRGKKGKEGERGKRALWQDKGERGKKGRGNNICNIITKYYFPLK